MSVLIANADAFANSAHEGQQRKYTGEPYIHHPREVAEIVRSAGGSDTMVAAALLHDVVEDCGVASSEIYAAFGDEIGMLVYWLTDASKPSDGNRKARKAIDRNHIAKAPANAQTIKLADLISNTRTIAERDPGFARIYLAEKRLLLAVLTNGNQTLHAEASRLCDYYQKSPSQD